MKSDEIGDAASANNAGQVSIQTEPKPDTKADSGYRVRPNADTIPCPGLVALYNNGALRPDAQGNVTSEHFDAALSGIGMSWGVRNWLKHVADKTDAMPGSFNLFKMRDSNLDHPGSSGIRDPEVNPDKLPGLLRFGENGRMYEKHLALAANHFLRTSPEKDPGLIGTTILQTEFTALLLVFGRVDDKGDRYVTFEDVRGLYLEGKYPEGWTPPTKDAMSVASVGATYSRIGLHRVWAALKSLFGFGGAR